MAYRIKVFHSPDSDDAFMFFPLQEGKIKDINIDFEFCLKDIQTLNLMALRREIEIGAASFHTYAYVYEDYYLLRSGASFGDGYGPILIGFDVDKIEDIKGKRIAIPGKLTSAVLTLRMFLIQNGINLNEIEEVEFPFDEIFDAIKNGNCDLGLIIHEGQLTYNKKGFKSLVDLGKWWKSLTGLALPLGANILKKDLPVYVRDNFPSLLKSSVEYSRKNLKEAIEYSKKFGRGIDEKETLRFVDMYVNEFTYDMGELGLMSVNNFFEMANKMGLIPKMPFIELL